MVRSLVLPCLAVVVSAMPIPAHAMTSMILLDLMQEQAEERADRARLADCVALDEALARASGQAEEEIRILRLMAQGNCVELVGPSRKLGDYDDSCRAMRARLDGEPGAGEPDAALSSRYKLECADLGKF